MVYQDNKVGGTDDTICSDKTEEELCNVLSEIHGFNPKEPGNIKKTVRKFLLKYHPDKAKPTEIEQLRARVHAIRTPEKRTHIRPLPSTLKKRTPPPRIKRGGKTRRKRRRKKKKTRRRKKKKTRRRKKNMRGCSKKRRRR